MDEPFGGLDPIVRDELVQAVLEISDQEGWTLFISSHDIDEVERLADWVGVLDHGRLRLAESVVSLQSRFRQVEVVVTDEPQLPTNPPKEWLSIEKAAHTIRFVHTDFVEGSAESEIRELLPETRHVMERTMSLKDIFLALGRSFRISAA
jgi:ABC-2 type transport system ATP-binding protein